MVEISKLAGDINGERLLMASDLERTLLVDMPNGQETVRQHIGGVEVFVIEGSISVAGEHLNQHDWFRAPPSDPVHIISEGSVLYIKKGGVARLWASI